MANGNGNGQQSTALARPSDGHYNQAGAAIERAGFGTREIQHVRETHGTALAERAKAEVSAMFIMAMQNPRTWETVWGSLIRECQRPSFAEAAIYRLKKGRKKNDEGQWVDNIVEGLTIGFARAALRAMGNVDISEPTIYEDEEKRIVEVCAVDLECNVRQRRQCMVSRSIERSDPDGRIVLGERKNSYGKTTYIVVPTDEEMEVKVAALVSKKRRDLILDMLPADLKDDCKATALATRQREDKTDPDLAKKKIIAAFAGIGINADELIKYLGHPLEQVTADERGELLGVYNAIKESETTWPDALREKLGDGAPADKAEAKPADKQADKLKEKLTAAPAKDKSGEPAQSRSRKPPPPTWQQEGEQAVLISGPFKLIVEATGPHTVGWWVFKDGTEIKSDEVEGEIAKVTPEAKAAAVAAAGLG